MGVGDALYAQDLLSVEMVSGEQISELSSICRGVARADLEGDAARQGHGHHLVIYLGLDADFNDGHSRERAAVHAVDEIPDDEVGNGTLSGRGFDGGIRCVAVELAA